MFKTEKIYCVVCVKYKKLKTVEYQTFLKQTLVLSITSETVENETDIPKQRYISK